ncbi:MAG TPA: hypothetical protein VFY78_12125 [Gammaproteobacteria bacterium]|nr:hypothetical protein [Gammaproteobacteria bacterium]
MNKITCILIIGLVVSACTSQPYVRFKTPNINGSLQINDAPAPGTLILLSLDAGDTECLRAVQRTRTDENSQFLLAAEKEHMDYTPLMTHYLDEWTICAEIQGVRRTLYSNNRYGMGSVSHGISLNCNFNTRAKNDNPCQQPLHD